MSRAWLSVAKIAPASTSGPHLPAWCGRPGVDERFHPAEPNSIALFKLRIGAVLVESEAFDAENRLSWVGRGDGTPCRDHGPRIGKQPRARCVVLARRTMCVEHGPARTRVCFVRCAEAFRALARARSCWCAGGDFRHAGPYLRPRPATTSTYMRIMPSEERTLTVLASMRPIIKAVLR